MSPDAAAVARLAGHRVLVVGDLVLDEYLTGRPSRISREAPVLVLDVVEQEYRAGSAGNPAANVVALGSHATIVGAIGCDPAGERLEAGLTHLGIGAEGLVRVASGVTSTKTRVLAQGFTGGLHGRQQVLRLDQVPELPLESASRCAACVSQLASGHDAVLLSDYRGGVIGAATIAASRDSGKPVAVDSQGDLRRFKGVDLVKINQAEAQAALGDVSPLSGGEALRSELDLRWLVITLGAEGMAVFGDGEPTIVPAVRATEVFDVTGAGDTVIAILTLGLLGGLSLRESAAVAAAAASIVVQRLGVATVSPAELLEALR